MELHELRVRDQRACGVGHGERITLRGFWIGRDRIKPARSARAQDGLCGPQLKHIAGFFLREHARNAPITILQQRQRLHALDHFDVRGCCDGIGQRFHDRLAGKVARNTRNARPRMRSLERQGKLAIRGAVERNAKLQKVAHAIGAFLCDQPRNDRIDNPCARRNRVGCMQRRLILGRQRGGEPALRPCGRGSLAQWRQRDHGASPRRKLQRKEKAGQPAANDQDIARRRHGVIIRSGPDACGISREPGHTS